MLFAGGLAVGVLFGVAAQHSRFCLRAASVEFSNLTFGPRMVVWLLAFFSALFFVQVAVSIGWIFPGETRQIGSVGSVSGAIIGGLMFGCGDCRERGNGCPVCGWLTRTTRATCSWFSAPGL